jgi:hypothetical protein
MSKRYRVEEVGADENGIARANVIDIGETGDDSAYGLTLEFAQILVDHLNNTECPDPAWTFIPEPENPNIDPEMQYEHVGDGVFHAPLTAQEIEWLKQPTIKEDSVAIGENSTASLDFAQPVCECGMLADECACTDDPAHGICTDCGAGTEGPDILLCDDCKPESEQDDAPEIPADVRAMVPAGADEHYTVTAYFTDCAAHDVRFETKEGALAAAQSTRDAFPEAHIAVAINRYGQSCAISTAEWNPFPHESILITDPHPFLPVDMDDMDFETAKALFHGGHGRAAFMRVTKSLAGAALLATLLLPGHASAQELPYHPGAGVVINGSACQVTHSWEDGSAIAHCRDHRVYAFDPDGSPAHAPQTWNRVKQTRRGPYGR